MKLWKARAESVSREGAQEGLSVSEAVHHQGGCLTIGCNTSCGTLVTLIQWWGQRLIRALKKELETVLPSMNFTIRSRE